ncbi:hypothetical protein CLOSTASPAR_01371 [[Clostridium] asparagiforme DSM 15981]|uniref:Uncharacterized protein n=1 Tax=[Clostridium] asparagiforme DSM 15981 TaxID=518636 RepID=C0CWK5_9FIRM|nr:hypothetical protein CLOSTASPAR_01371 [[Clostridium] asparagiforme DSM 15981]
MFAVAANPRRLCQRIIAFNKIPALRRIRAAMREFLLSLRTIYDIIKIRRPCSDNGNLTTIPGSSAVLFHGGPAKYI